MVKKIIYSTSTRRLSTGEISSLSKLAESDYLVLKNLALTFPSGLDKNTLTERAWPGRLVTESSLKVSIYKLRKVLNDELGLKVQILHIRGSGYLLSESITLVKNTTPQERLTTESNIFHHQDLNTYTPLFSQITNFLVIITSVILIIAVLKAYSLIGLL